MYLRNHAILIAYSESLPKFGDKNFKFKMLLFNYVPDSCNWQEKRKTKNIVLEQKRQNNESVSSLPVSKRHCEWFLHGTSQTKKRLQWTFHDPKAWLLWKSWYRKLISENYNEIILVLILFSRDFVITYLLRNASLSHSDKFAWKT